MADCQSSFHAIIIVLEGNVGAGKSTLLTRLSNDATSLKTVLGGPWSKIEVRPIVEPIGEWTNVDGENMLEAYYVDPHRYAFEFQSAIQHTYLQQLRQLTSCEAVRERENENRLDIIITERSFFSNRHVFTELAYKKGYLTKFQYDVLTNEFQSAVTGHKFFPCLDGLIYLRAAPNKCMSRVIRRGRMAEVCADSFFNWDYITEIGNVYTSWLEAADVQAKVTQCRDGSDPRHNESFVKHLVIQDSTDNIDETYARFKDTVIAIAKAVMLGGED